MSLIPMFSVNFYHSNSVSILCPQDPGRRSLREPLLQVQAGLWDPPDRDESPGDLIWFDFFCQIGKWFADFQVLGPVEEPPQTLVN